MKSGGQSIHVDGIFSAPCRLRRESGQAQLRRGFTSLLQYLRKSLLAAESSIGAALRETHRVRLVWWGFSGVKDARKNVLIAEASASAGICSAQGQKERQEQQSESRSKATRKQAESKATASSKRNENRSGTAWLTI